MKYTESYSGRSKKLGTGFYVLIACCLLIIGGAAWFALSNYAGNETVPKTESTPNNSYNDDTSSYNDTVPDVPRVPDMTESVAQSVEKEPYSSEEATDDSVSFSFTMPAEGEVLKDFSNTELQYSSTYGDMRVHSGIDIACKNGTAISACGNGTVKAIENDASMGNTVTLELVNGITLKYSALTDLKVKAGSKVKMGDIIGKSTTVPSECNDNEHIHIEALKKGEPVSFLEVLGLK